VCKKAKIPDPLQLDKAPTSVALSLGLEDKMLASVVRLAPRLRRGPRSSGLCLDA